MISSDEPMYVYRYQKDGKIFANSLFNRFWKSTDKVDDYNTNECALFNYRPLTYSDIDLMVYGIKNTNNKLKKTTTVDDTPSLLREVSLKNPLFPRIDNNGNSGIYDFQKDRYLLENIKFLDLGDISVNSEKGLNKLNDTVSRIFKEKVRFLTFGGDHAITYYNMKSINRETGKKPILIQFDAHQDVGVHEINRQEVHQGNFVSYLIDHDIVSHVIQVGVRGIRAKNQVANSDTITTFNNSQWHDLSENFINKIIETNQNTDIYISIDIDVLDPSIFSLVDFPVNGGLGVEQLLTSVETIFKSKSNVIGADIVEINGNGLVENNDYDLIMYILVRLMNEFERRID